MTQKIPTEPLHPTWAEKQQQPEKAPGRRLRFYTGAMVSHLLQKGMDYDELLDQVMIYIGTTDIWKLGRTIYEFQMTEIRAYFSDRRWTAGDFR